MQAFEYADPKSKEDAVKLLAEASGEGAVLAGGTDLLSLMKDYVVAPKRLVNIKAIDELRGVEYDAADGLLLGALTTLTDLLTDDKVAEEYPSLTQAAQGIRSPQIQNMGTVAGELCQRPRCWYYRSGFGLLAQAYGKSLVTEGDNRYHAILGNEGPAYFVNPSSLAPAFIALGATLEIFGSNGARQVAVEDFYRVPRSDGEKEYDLAADEIVTAIRVPPAAKLLNATYEVRAKESLDWPLAAAAVALELAGDKVASARVVLGQVAPTPWLSKGAADTLVGKAVTEETAQEAGAAAVAGAKALSGNAHKVQLARVAVKRAVLLAAGREV